jgi:hypothetical protein
MSRTGSTRQAAMLGGPSLEGRPVLPSSPMQRNWKDWPWRLVLHKTGPDWTVTAEAPLSQKRAGGGCGNGRWRV